MIRGGGGGGDTTAVEEVETPPPTHSPTKPTFLFWNRQMCKGQYFGTRNQYSICTRDRA